MQVVRRFAVLMMLGRGLTGSAARCLTGRMLTARELTARASAAARGLAVMIAGTTAVLACVLVAGGVPAMATADNAPGSTLASVIPSTAVPSSRVTFSVYCATTRATSATLFGRTIGLTEQIKMRANPGAGDFTVSVLLPGGIRPGTYHPSIDCSDGTSTTARLLVPSFGAADSTSGVVGTWLTTGGLVLLGAGALTGGIALWRRRRGSSRRPDESDQADEAVPSEHSEHSEHSDRFDYSAHSNYRF